MKLIYIFVIRKSCATANATDEDGNAKFKMESFLRLGIESPPPACFAFHHSPCVVVYKRDQGCTVVEPTVQKQLACNMQILRALDRDPRSFVPCENVRASAQLCRVHAQRDLHIPREHRPMSMRFQTCHHLPRARHHLYCACARHAMSAPALPHASS